MIRKTVTLSDIATLCKPNCRIKDPARVENILNEFIRCGFDKLQLVSDFDFTITKHTDSEGQKVWSTFDMLYQCKSLPPSCSKKSSELTKIYKPIEIDPTIPISDKIDKMIEWWVLAGRLLRGLPFDERDLDDVASLMKNSIKDGTIDMFHKLNQLNVPILVFSAGVGNCVEAVLKHYNIMFSNVKVISNFLKYENGTLDGIDEKTIIHSFNKNETAIKGTEYYDLVHDRDHIIVMGDSIGDAGMADGVPSSSHVLKIGFLFENIEQSLALYMNTFDIVLIKDETMDVPNSILKLLEH